MDKTLPAIRLAFMLLCMLGGWLVCYSVTDWDDHRLLASFIGLSIGALVVLVDILLKGFSLRSLSAVTFGLAVGALISYLVGTSPLFDRGDEQNIFIARLALFLSCTYICAVIALRMALFVVNGIPLNADGTSPSKPAAFSTYQQMVPHYRLGTPGNQSVNHAFTIGRVRFIVTDTRSSRAPRTLADASRRTMLGQVQLEWFERELEAAIGHALVVWVNTVPWITRRKGQTDGWERYSLERTRIADRIASLGLTRRMVMLSGDAHMVAIDDGTNSNYRTGAAPDQPGFPVVQAAPMDRLTSEKGGPYSNGISRKRGQFGLMEVTDDGSRLRVELSGRDIRGLVIPRMRIVMECLDGQPCRVIENDAVRRRP